MSLFNNDVGDAMQQQITPYAVYQSQVDQVTFDANAGMKVCVIDSGLDSSNPDFIWGNITGDNDSGTGNWFDNGGPHGTHVAGTIGAAQIITLVLWVWHWVWQCTLLKYLTNQAGVTHLTWLKQQIYVLKQVRTLLV